MEDIIKDYVHRDHTDGKKVRICIEKAWETIQKASLWLGAGFCFAHSTSLAPRIILSSLWWPFSKYFENTRRKEWMRVSQTLLQVLTDTMSLHLASLSPELPVGTCWSDTPGCWRNRLPNGVDSLHCGHGLGQGPQGRRWDQRGRLARTALQFTVSKVCLEGRQKRGSQPQLGFHFHIVSCFLSLTTLSCYFF